jgi:hypothetical protein
MLPRALPQDDFLESYTTAAGASTFLRFWGRPSGTIQCEAQPHGPLPSRQRRELCPCEKGLILAGVRVQVSNGWFAKRFTLFVVWDY